MFIDDILEGAKIDFEVNMTRVRLPDFALIDKNLRFSDGVLIGLMTLRRISEARVKSHNESTLRIQAELEVNQTSVSYRVKAKYLPTIRFNATFSRIAVNLTCLYVPDESQLKILDFALTDLRLDEFDFEGLGFLFNPCVEKLVELSAKLLDDVIRQLVDKEIGNIVIDRTFPIPQL